MPAEQLDTIREKLQAAEASLARVESAAPAAALRLHTGQPEDGDQALLERLPELRAHVDNLRLALAGAEQAEADHQQAERVRTEKAQGNATRQWLGKIERSADKAIRAIEELATAYADILEARRAAMASAPPKMRQLSDLQYRLHDERVGRMVLVEIARALKAKGVEPARAYRHFEIEYQRAGQTVPLIETVSRVVADARGMLPPIERNTKPSSAAQPPAVVEEAGADGVSTPVPSVPALNSAADLASIAISSEVVEEPVLLCAAGSKLHAEGA